MKYIYFIILLTAFGLNSNGQNVGSDSLIQLLKETPQDTNRVRLLKQIAGAYYFSKPDSCLIFSLEAIKLSRELKWTVAEISSMNNAGEALRFLGDYPGSLKMQLDGLKLSRETNDLSGEADCLGFIGLTYVEFGQYRLGLQYLLPCATLSNQLGKKVIYTFCLSNIGNAYNLLNIMDSAFYYQLKAKDSYVGLTHGPLKSLILTRLGNAYADNGQVDSAMANYNKALENCFLVNDKVNISKVQGKVAKLYAERKNYDSSIVYARHANANANLTTQRLELLESSILLSSLFRQMSSPDSALYYQDQVIALNEKLYGPEKFKQLQLLVLGEQQQQQQQEQDQQMYRNKIKYLILFIILSVFMLISFFLLRSNQHKQKAKSKIEKAYSDLKTVQGQLIQAEKLASLGEMTAGIAHEIQNPLNFVNNFSSINAELIDELQIEIDKGNTAEVKIIANDIKENEVKIIHHGQRAESIVRNMLQHSRKSTGVKEPTNINTLSDEYLRLSYHGLRAKDKSFNADFKLDLDPTLPLVNVIPQDIGRVLLNLFNNAFWATSTKLSGHMTGISSVPAAYSPLVTLTTKNLGDKIEIRIVDNGPGIPDSIKDKIFQPFFTTKPTGQGTGLGLSLAYDIITKVHQGTIKVNSSDQGSEFILSLPVN